VYYQEVFAWRMRFARTFRNLTQRTQRKATESTEVSVPQTIEMVAGSAVLRMAGAYLTKRPSRSWSRPTKVLEERNLRNRSEISRF
jgi:hypothetical protein